MKHLASTLLGTGAVALALAVWGSLGDDAGDGRARLVVTQVPAAALPGAWSAGAPLASRYPSGSRVVLVEPSGRGVVRILSDGLDAAGAPEVAPRGDRVVFAGRRGPTERWCLYEAQLHRGGPERRVELEGDCSDPAYLPGGEIVFAVAAPSGASHLCRTTEQDGVQRITFGPEPATHPTVLRDGRILFSMGVGECARDAAEVSLFTVNPDGTLLDPFTGLHDEWPVELRARQTADGRVVFLGGESAGPSWSLAAVEFARPMAGRSPLVPTAAGEGSGDLRAPLVVASASPSTAGELLVTGRAARAGSAATFGVYALAAEGSPTRVVFDDPDWHEVEAALVAPRPAPRGRPSCVDPERRDGLLVCYDAGYSDGVHGPPAGAPAPVAVSVQTTRRVAHQAGLASRGLEEADPGIVELGRLNVAPDGSFFARVPADVPLRVRSLDADRATISTSEWFWVRSGEVRACFGCHERRDTAPPNRPVQAIKGPPQELGAPGGDPSE